ncbi:MAG: RluA family pseudouridine synthase [Clostridia bacterium]|nr:RluA family pseudouridine synthase [Clostridia bacterium]
MLVSKVPDAARNIRLQKYIQRAWPMLPGFAVRNAFKKRDVRVNGERSDGERVLNPGDEVKIFTDKKYEDFSLEILYADEFLVSFVKPKGLPVDLDQDGIGEDTVLTRLRRIYESARLVHRLDAPTGGVMLAALTDDAERALAGAFYEHKIQKHYQALVKGSPKKDYGHMKAYLLKDAKSALVRVTDKETPGARRIETAYRVVKRYEIIGEALSDVDVEIFTGRTHQIRAHMSHIGHPLIGDDKYGDREIMKKLKCTDLCLWCKSLTIGKYEGLQNYEGQTFFKEKPEWKI